MPDQLPPDDLTIEDDELLYRRVYPAPGVLIPNATGDGYRPRSGSLKDSRPLSVDLGSLSTPQQTCNRDKSQPFHVAQFTAKMVRDAGGRIVRNSEPNNPAHALIYGTGKDGLLSGGQVKIIARQAQIILINDRAPR